MMLHSEQEHSMAALTAGTLASLDDRVPTPTYDRTRTPTGVVHIGVGGFPRAPGDVPRPPDERGKALDWGICGVGVMPADA